MRESSLAQIRDARRRAARLFTSWSSTGLWFDVRESFMLRQYQSYYAAQMSLGERGNRARIDAMFVERVRADLQLDTGLGELAQFRCQVVCPLQAGDR